MSEIQLRSGKIINKEKAVVIIKEEPPREQFENQQHQENQKQNEPGEPNEPPSPERLLVKKTDIPIEYYLESKLRNVCIKIPLLQAIRDIPIYTKIIKHLCIKKSGR